MQITPFSPIRFQGLKISFENLQDHEPSVFELNNHPDTIELLKTLPKRHPDVDVSIRVEPEKTTAHVIFQPPASEVPLPAPFGSPWGMGFRAQPQESLFDFIGRIFTRIPAEKLDSIERLSKAIAAEKLKSGSHV